MATAHDFAFTSIEGKPLKLADYAGKPILLVNTASACGLTPQYAGLEKLQVQLISATGQSGKTLTASDSLLPL